MPSSARWLGLVSCLLVLGVGSAHAQCVPRFVDATTGSDASTDCALGSSCLTIQHAVNVDAAAGCSGDTVNVAAGTYTEQITILTTLKLAGAGTATTTIKAPTPPLAGSNDIVTIGAMANVELTGFTVTCPLVSASCRTLGAGIDVLPGGTANIHDNTIAEVRHEPLDGCQEGLGIVAGTALGAAVTVTILNNMVVHYQKNGITVRGQGSRATITGNTVTGAGATPAIAQNGIQVSSGAIATVSGNIVSGNECDNPACGSDPLGDFATGILLFHPAAGTMVTNNNTFTANDVGIYNLAQGTTIMGNTLSQNRSHGIILDEGEATVASHPLGRPLVRRDCAPIAGITLLPAATATIQNNMILDVRHDPLDGCQTVAAIAVGIPPTSPATATITNNTITGYQKTGIVVKGTGSMATINGNTVTGAGPQTVLAQNGIQVSNGAGATVTGNTVSGNECNVVGACGPDPLANTQSVGILLFGTAAGTTVMG